MTISEKLVKIAENEQKIYDKGKADMLSDFWDKWQDYGNRTDYDRGFAGWNADMADFLKPKYDIRPTHAYMIFAKNNALTDLPKWCADCGIELDFENCTSLTYIISDSNVTHIGIVNTTSARSLLSVFYQPQKLTTIDKIVLRTDGNQTFNDGTFICKNLENITFEGTIGNNIWFNYCTKLTTASLLSILTALSKDSTLATGKTITLATAHQAKIEADADCTEQLGAAIAAGWTVAYV